MRIGSIIISLLLTFLILMNCADDKKPTDLNPGDTTGVPSAVTGVTVTGITANSIGLSWVNSTSPDADTIRVVYSTDGAFPATITDGTLFSEQSAVVNTAAITGLAANTPYWITVFVRDQDGNWSQGANIQATTNDVIVAPGTDTVPPVNVSSLAVTSVSYYGIELAWTGSTSNDADSVRVVYRIDGTSPTSPTNGTVYATYAAATSTVSMSGLNEGTQYWIGVFVQDTAGNWSSGAFIDAVTPVDTSGIDTSACQLLAAGEPCAVNYECCSGYCDTSGRCAIAPGGCDPIGKACVSGATCCSGNCSPNADSQFVCTPGVAQCRVHGDSCSVAADCCSMGCKNHVCTDSMCLMSGEACTENSDCCGNQCDPTLHECVSGGQCLPAGENCSAGGSSTCCSQLCLDMADGTRRCSPGSFCRVELEVCTNNGDCCNGKCEGGFCAKLQECAVVGEVCDQNSKCCSYACVDDGTGFKSCQYLGGCRPFGEMCRKDADCCNLYASNGGPGVCEIFDAVLGLGICANPPGCAPAGEVCGPGAHECCPGGQEGEDACKPTSIGVERCFGWGDTSRCIEDQQPCAFGDQCCSGICAPEPVTGNLVCSPQCLDDGLACTTHPDCCSGYCDPLTLTCRQKVTECLELGVACSLSGGPECCSGYCYEGTCAPGF